MRSRKQDAEAFARFESAVAFRLFGDSADPTLSVPEQIAAQVGDRIVDGRMPPGARIGEQELADEFKVSRGPVREAIRILEREGLATVLPRRGAVVTELSAQEVRELFEIRAGLFDIVARKIVQAPDPELLALMRAGVSRLEALATVPDGGDAYAETTYRLMLLAARACGNARLARMLSALSLQTLRYSKISLASLERRARSVKSWRQAQLALERGDAEQVMQLTRLRIEQSGDEAARQLDPTQTARATRP